MSVSSSRSSMIGVFTHIILTAPSLSIADVYNQQLSLYKSSSDSGVLSNCELLVCIPDPWGLRVGSGGGTLNVLRQLRDSYGLQVGDDHCKILIIHSGGDSQRAPLYSLCGKAWMSINSVIGGSREIASTLSLLILEISLFCSKLPGKSLVVASSDVMLDITTGSIEGLVFTPNCVTVVAVPESIHVAKNHGVLVCSSSKTDRSNPVVNEHASHYLQKPSIDRMMEVDACLQETEDPLNVVQYTLVDTGIVIFQGLALSRLFDLTTHAVIERCTLHGQLGGDDSQSVTDKVLRIELYSDILHTLELRGQETHSIEEYLRRLGLPADFCSHLNQQADDTAAAALYRHALLALWETLNRTKLYLLYIRAGKFDHLGTTREALSLLSMGRRITTSTSNSSDQCKGGAVEQSRGQLSKKAVFAAKYRLQSEVLSCMRWEGDGDGTAVFQGIAINSRLGHRSHPLNSSPLRALEHDKGQWRLSATEQSSEGAMLVLVEHSLLSGSVRLPSTGIVSHMGALVGRDLHVEEGSMMQQVFLKPSAELLCTAVTTGGEPVFALIVLNILDDIKGFYPNSSICSSEWETLFRLSSTQCSDIWGSGSTTDRTIWNARLFPLSKTDDRGNLHIYCDASKEWIPSSKLSLTWMQSLPHHRDDSMVDESCRLAIHHWRLAKRVSLSDILRHGDAAAMFEWRTWLQLDDHHLSVSDSDEVDQLWDLSAAFEWILRYYTLFRGCRLDHMDVHVCMLSQWLLVLCGLVRRDIIDSDMNMLWRSLINAKAAVSDESMRGIVMDLNQLFDFMCTSPTSAAALSQRVALHLRSFIFDGAQLSMVLTALLRCHGLIPQEYLSRILFQSAWLVSNHKDVVLDAALKTKQMAMNRCVDDMMMSLASGQSTFQAEPLFKTIADFTLSALAASTDMRRCVDTITSGVVVIDLSSVLESLAQKIIACQIQRSLVHHIGVIDHCSNQRPHPPTLHRSMVSVARSPVRIDLAGGWSDTPPICYEKTGAVLNVAVRVDEQYPIRCASRWIDKPILLLHSMLRADTDIGDSIDGSTTFTTETCECIDIADVASFPHAVDEWKCVLLKAAVVVLKVIDVHNRDSSLSHQLMARYSGGLEIHCVSDLPAGSGMGGSSVLAATILKSLSQLLGMESTPRELIYLVSQVEQLLTTGGGWQDQMGCIHGGFKIGRSLASLPLTVSVEAIPTSPIFIDQLQKRMCLVYTGQQRLAKHTLINALRYNAFTRPSHSTAAPFDDTVSRLIRGAEDGFKLLSALDCDNVDSTVNGLAACINEYWGLKKRMAAGSEPIHIQRLFSLLSPHCDGLSLCGAGAGGYAVVILKDEDSVGNVAAILDEINQLIVGEVDRLLSLHRVTVDAVGLHAQLHSRHEHDSLRGYILL